MNKFIAIEGIDGSGKSTQIDLLTKYLDSEGHVYKYLHFPRTDSPIYGEMVAKFLRGEFGAVELVNPYFVSLLYAGDRENAKPIINNWLAKGYLVIVDRYVYSNIAFQCAKVGTQEKKKKLREWIIQLEYGYNKIPSPCISIYLHVPFEFAVSKLSNSRDGSSRAYLKGKDDIHESSIKLQTKVASEYSELVDRNEDICLVNCIDRNKQILSPKVIHNEIVNILVSGGIIRK